MHIAKPTNNNGSASSCGYCLPHVSPDKSFPHMLGYQLKHLFIAMALATLALINSSYADQTIATIDEEEIMRQTAEKAESTLHDFLQQDNITPQLPLVEYDLSVERYTWLVEKRADDIIYHSAYTSKALPVTSNGEGSSNVYDAHCVVYISMIQNKIIDGNEIELAQPQLHNVYFTAFGEGEERTAMYQLFTESSLKQVMAEIKLKGE